MSEVIIEGLIDVESEISKISPLPKETISRVLRDKKLIDLFEAKLSEEEYWNLVEKECNTKIQKDKWSGIIYEKFKRDMPGTKELIQELIDRGHNLALLSDHAKEWTEFIKKHHNIQDLFESTMFSYKINVTKKDTGAFRKVLDQTNFDPEHTLFIDDSKNNIEIAKLSGIRHTHLFTTADNLREFLKEKNLL